VDNREHLATPGSPLIQSDRPAGSAALATPSRTRAVASMTWQAEMVTEIDTRTHTLVCPGCRCGYRVDRLGIDASRVRQLVRERQLIAVRRGEQHVAGPRGVHRRGRCL
jgi:hypothetical protein